MSQINARPAIQRHRACNLCGATRRAIKRAIKRRRVLPSSSSLPSTKQSPLLDVSSDALSCILSFTTLDERANLSATHSALQKLVSSAWIQTVWLDNQYRSGPSPQQLGLTSIRSLHQLQLPFTSMQSWNSFVMNDLNRDDLPLALRKIDLGLMDEDEIRTVIKRCPHLTSVICHGSCIVNDEILQLIGQYCPHLKQLILPELTRISEKGMMDTVSQWPEMEHMVLDFGYYITNACLKVIGTHCPRLKTLRLYHCYNVRDEGLTYLTSSCSQLTHLDISHCTNISDTGLSILARNCPQLEHLSMEACKKITNRGIEQLAKSCPKLKYLDLNAIGLRDRSLFALSQHCPQLTYLDVSFNHCVTEKGVEAVLKHCPLLKRLDLQDIDLDKESLQSWMHIIHMSDEE
jgi:Leucine-rich repeat (LRR) protein